MKFEDAYKHYLKYVEIRQKVQSRGTLQRRFENRILPFFRNYDIYKISESDYIEWQRKIETLDFSNNYKKGLHYLMRGFFEYCIIYHGLQSNVAKKVGNFKMKNIKIKHDYYSLKEFKLFIKNVDNEIYRQFFSFMFFTGTRPGEAMALRFSDLDKNIISVNKTISEHSYNGSRIVDDPKSLSSFRSIVIDKKMRLDLMKLKKYYSKIYCIDDYDYFIFGGDKPLAPTTINRHKKKACQKANLRPIKLHEFRHSHATLLYSKNVSMQTIKERLGHSNINITMSVYVHLTEKHKKRITRILNLLRLNL